MRDSLLLLMTPSMSLEKWDSIGQLSRELNYYEELSKRSKLNLIIFSYGRNDLKYNLTSAIVLTMPSWIPKNIPYKLQNWIYIVSSLFIYRRFFEKVVICKTNQFTAADFGLLLKFIYKIPLVIRMGFYYSHFQPINNIRKFKERISFKLADKILTTSSEATDYICEKYSIAPTKIITICNSINLDRFKPTHLEKEWDIIFVAKLESQKNIGLVAEVFKEIKGKILIIGMGSLDHLIKDAVKINSGITWKERVDNIDLPNYYNRSKIFVLLSDHEGNPKVLLEAMACGLTCVVTNVPGIRECIKHEANGIIVTKKKEEIVNTLYGLLNEPSKMDSIGKKAIEWIKEKCDYSKNIDLEIELYNQIPDFNSTVNKLEHHSQ